VLGAGRADPAAGIGRRRGERPAAGGEQGLHRRMGGTRSAIVGRPAVTSAAIGRIAAQRHDQGQRPRPMRGGSARASSSEIADRFGLRRGPHVDDQRIEARAALGGVDARDRFGIGGVGGEAVDGLGRHRDRLAGEDQPRRLGDRLVVERQDAGVLRATRARYSPCSSRASFKGSPHDLHAARRRPALRARPCRRIDELAGHNAFAEATPDLVDAMLEGAARSPPASSRRSTGSATRSARNGRPRG
jgi:hypothetical protein